jgi:hypothetical protein
MEKIGILVFLIGGIYDFRYRKVPIWLIFLSFVAIILTKSIFLIGVSLVYLLIYIMNKSDINFGYIDFNLLLYLGYIGFLSGLEHSVKLMVFNIIGIIFSLLIYLIYKLKYKEKRMPILTILMPLEIIILLRGLM